MGTLTATGHPRARAKIARATAICAAFAAQGCVLEDVTTATANGAMTQRRGNSTNDVGYHLWRSDYGLFMKRADASQSTGWFNQGPADQFFGRFCRGFSAPSDATATIGLTLDAGLWGGLPLQSSRRLTIRVAFLDAAVGSFSLGYDSSTGAKSLPIAHGGSGRWIEVCWRVTDGRFEGGNDIWLQNSDNVGEIFDSVEVYDTPNWEDLSLQAVTGCTTYDEHHNLVMFPPPPPPPPSPPPPCADSLSRCPRKIADGSWTCATRAADCQLTCGLCGGGSVASAHSAHTTALKS